MIEEKEVVAVLGHYKGGTNPHQPILRQLQVAARVIFNRVRINKQGGHLLDFVRDPCLTPRHAERSSSTGRLVVPGVLAELSLYLAPKLMLIDFKLLHSK